MRVLPSLRNTYKGALKEPELAVISNFSSQRDRGIELGTFRSQARHPNQSATDPTKQRFQSFSCFNRESIPIGGSVRNQDNVGRCDHKLH